MLKSNPYMKSYLNIIKESISMSSIKKRQRIANEIGGEYDIETNTIDCKGNKVKFKNNWLTNGTFDFKLVNTSNDWSEMFDHCIITHLPEHFTIPENVVDCNSIFSCCKSLTHLPEDFTIPNSVKNCSYMFYGCKSLTHLSNNFTIPDSIENCSFMFYSCESLTNLPNNFTIPNSVENYCSYMFAICKSLTHLPNNFTIPNNIKDCSWMFYYCKSLIDLPENFHIPIDAKCKNIFDGCDKLENKDPEQYTMYEV